MPLRTLKAGLVRTGAAFCCLIAIATNAPAADYGATTSQDAVIAMPANRAATSSARDTDTPDRGMRMRQVIAAYGEPARRHAAVGYPPITRWDYPGYRVYFEYDHVIHSVVPDAPEPVAHANQLEGSTR